MHAQLERFVCIYTKVNELRWFFYSNRAAEGENLPPTCGLLDLHIRRSLGEKLVKITRVSQNQLHLAGHSAKIQITSPLFAV